MSKTSVRFLSPNSLASVSVLKPVTVGVLLVWNKIYHIWSQEPDLDFRRVSYRQFALCRHSKLGRGNRCVMPSCVVLEIRHTYYFALSSRLFMFLILNYLSADTSTLRNAGKIGHVTCYVLEWTIFPSREIQKKFELSGVRCK